MSSPVRVVALLAAITFSGSACSDDSSEAVDPTISTTTTSVSSGSENPQPTDAGDSDSELVAELDATIQALRDGYHFTTRVELSGEVVTEVVGDNVAGDSEFTVSTEQTTLEVVSVEGLVWTRPAGAAEWSAAQPEDIDTDPLGPLLDPASRTVVGELITMVYPGAAFGLDQDTVEVQVRIDNGAIELVHTADTVTVRSRFEVIHPETTITAPA